MSAKRLRASILSALDTYEAILAKVHDDEFQRTPAEGSWSYAEVYSHVILSGIGSLMAIGRCIQGTHSVPGKFELKARLVLLFGRFPGKIKAPPAIAAMVEKMTKEEAANGMKKLRQKLMDVGPIVENAQPEQKIQHPRLGLLNALQWLRFMEIHTRHHLKQINRIQKMLNNPRKVG